MKKFSMVAAFAIAALSATAANAANELAGVKILSISGLTESSLNATNMSEARTVLTGAGAIVTDVAVGSFSAASLSGINILYAGLSNNQFSASQISTINSFVNSGGGLVAVGTERACCFGPSWEQIARSFSLEGLGGDRNAKALATTPSSPIVSGPFGIAASYVPAATGAFDKNSLPTGTTIVWEGVDNNPIIVTLNTNGRAFFFADTNFMQNGRISNGGNRTIWGNAFAFTGKVDAVPEPATWGMMIIGFGAMGAAMRRRRATVSFA